MENVSNPSRSIFSIGVPEPEISAEFVYNYYTADEQATEDSGIPDAIKIRSAEQIDYTSTNFSLRVPRYILLKWSLPAGTQRAASAPGRSIKDNISKIVFEEGFSSGYVPYTFSNVQEIEDAYRIINKGVDFGASQATTINNFIKNVFTGSASTPTEEKNRIAAALQNIEQIGDRPEQTLAIKIYDSNGKKVINTSGFDQALRNDVRIPLQISPLILPDIFVSSSFIDPNEVNGFYQRKIDNQEQLDESISPVATIEPVSKPSLKIIGYIIDKYDLSSGSPAKINTFYVESAETQYYVDLFVKYGTPYHYSIRSVCEVTTNGSITNGNSTTTVGVIYYMASRPTFLNSAVFGFDDTPPPEPTDLNFIWNYRISELNFVWAMPSNPQRDITQYQVFRRKSINEPFELLQQICFDFSLQKSVTGEAIDGNSLDMTDEQKAYVRYENNPLSVYVDKDFKVDPDMLTSSKYIYTVASVDAHGFISNYSSQFEVTFDFYQNKLVKKLISSPGAPRPYPNLLLNVDLFKDVIQVRGEDSTNMRVYFMPEYYKLGYTSIDSNGTRIANGRVENMITTVQDNGFYQLQFINLQNQKSDSIKISIDDPQRFMR